MDDKRKSSKAGERAAEGLRESTSKDEAKNESKMGHDLVKGADRFEERSKSSDGKSAEEKQKGESRPQSNLISSRFSLGLSLSLCRDQA